MIYSSLAQSVEHSAVNRVVVGSSPTRGAINKKPSIRMAFIYFFFDLVHALVNSRRLLIGSFATAPSGRLREQKELSSGRNSPALQAGKRVSGTALRKNIIISDNFKLSSVTTSTKLHNLQSPTRGAINKKPPVQYRIDLAV